MSRKGKSYEGPTKIAQDAQGTQLGWARDNLRSPEELAEFVGPSANQFMQGEVESGQYSPMTTSYVNLNRDPEYFINSQQAVQGPYRQTTDRLSNPQQSFSGQHGGDPNSEFSQTIGRFGNPQQSFFGQYGNDPNSEFSETIGRFRDPRQSFFDEHGSDPNSSFANAMKYFNTP